MMKKIALASVLTIAAGSASAWDMPFFGNGYNNGMGNGTGNGEGSMDMSFSMKTSAKANTDVAANGYNTVYGQNGYAPYAYKALHPQFMLLMGGGEVDLKDVGDDNVFVIQPSAGIEINVFRWFRLGLEGGYRFVTNTDLPAINDNDLSDFYGELKFKFGWSWGR